MILWMGRDSADPWRRRLDALGVESPGFQLTRILELDFPFRAYAFRAGRLEPAVPPVLREVSGRRASRPICAHLFRQGRAHWMRAGLGRASRELRALDAALAGAPRAELRLLRGRLRQCVYRIEEAVEDYRLVLAGEPANARARAWLGEALIQLGAPREGRRELLRALRTMPEDPWLLAWLAESSRLLGDARAARARLSRALALRPRLAELLVLRGVDGDMAALDRAARLAPRLAWARILRGHHRHRAGDFAGAERDFTAVVRADPLCLWAFVMRARARLARGRVAAARRDFRAAMAIEPGCIGAPSREVLRHGYLPFHPFAAPLHWVAGRVRRLQRELRDGRAETYGALAEYREFYEFSLPEIERGLLREPDHPVLNAFRARSLTLKGEAWLPASLAAMDRTAALAPGWGWVYAWRAEILKRVGRPREAMADENRCVRRGPSYPIVYAWRGGLRRLFGDPRGALRDLDRSLDLIRELGDDYDFVHKERALALWERGLRDAAVAEFTERACFSMGVSWAEPAEARAALARLGAFAARRADQPRAHAIRADLLLRAGRARDAERAAGRALSAEPACALAWGVRAEARRRLGRRRAALADIDRALALRPFAPRFYALRANLHYELGRPAESVGDLDRFLSLLAREDGYQVFRARLRRRLGQSRRALRELDDLLLVQIRSAWAHYERFFHRLRAGSLAAALQDLTRARVERPLRCGGKTVYLELPARSLIAEDFRALARARGPGFARAWRAALRLQTGDASALGALRRAMRGRAARWAAAWSAAERLGRGDAAGALRDAEAALRAAPGFAWAGAIQGEALARLGRSRQARRALDGALRLDPRLAEAYAARAELRRRGGDRVGALRDMDLSLQHDCRNAWAWRRRGEYRLGLGDAEGAARDLDEALLMQEDYAEARALRELAARGTREPGCARGTPRIAGASRR